MMTRTSVPEASSSFRAVRRRTVQQLEVPGTVMYSVSALLLFLIFIFVIPISLMPLIGVQKCARIGIIYHRDSRRRKRRHAVLSGSMLALKG